MDFADMLSNRFDGEAEMKKNNSALICFSSLETGKVLSRLATRIIRSKLSGRSLAACAPRLPWTRIITPVAVIYQPHFIIIKNTCIIFVIEGKSQPARVPAGCLKPGCL